MGMADSWNSSIPVVDILPWQLPPNRLPRIADRFPVVRPSKHPSDCSGIVRLQVVPHHQTMGQTRNLKSLTMIIRMSVLLYRLVPVVSVVWLPFQRHWVGRRRMMGNGNGDRSCKAEAPSTSESKKVLLYQSEIISKPKNVDFSNLNSTGRTLKDQRPLTI